jgi:CheY-like chemotaxis protein
VAATAGFTDTSESDCLSAGMDGHLLKPLSVDLLGAEIRRVMATI